MTARSQIDMQLAGFEAALPDLRPKLHRYCARMTGSVIDGEDVLQEALFNASKAVRNGTMIEEIGPWLFRIAHNTALNHIRARNSEIAMKQSFSLEMPSFSEMPKCSETADNLRPFLSLTPKQRSTVILRDVLGYSADEVAGLTQSTVSSVKSALHRGRALLQDHAKLDDQTPVALSDEQRQKLERYTSCFNAHQFDILRDMLSSEVHLELVSVEDRNGREAVGGYFGNYSRQQDWVLVPGLVEGQAAILVMDRADPAKQPGYFILVEFDGDTVLNIRDFRYARYVMEDTQWQRV